ncbi:hypothetical protein CTAYLR_009889 [Chrysophaeum taylorii]|uniref:RBR-type E3 ubiquitin transferase n=1 Tax=Chrysophaeum taylorii TaxID=2483200 RepID=A0AAD7UI73_9STRA|nr:hypothetical protein CTAYLR_009889 [Chrysophaeum taylorii]
MPGYRIRARRDDSGGRYMAVLGTMHGQACARIGVREHIHFGGLDDDADDDYEDWDESCGSACSRVPLTLGDVMVPKPSKKAGRVKDVAEVSVEEVSTSRDPPPKKKTRRMVGRELLLPRPPIERRRSEPFEPPSPLARSASAPPAFAPRVVLSELAAVAKVADRVEVGPDAWYSMTVENGRTAFVVVARVARGAGRATAGLRVRPLVGASPEDAMDLEAELAAVDATPAEALATARRLIEASRFMVAASTLHPAPHPLAKAMRTAFRVARVRHDSLTPFQLWRESSKEENTTGGLLCATTSNGPCAICLEDGDRVEDGLALSCGHRCCSACWHAYLTSEARNGSADVRCPGARCAVRVNLCTAASLAGEGPGAADAVWRIAKWRRESFADPTARWCPTCDRLLVGPASHLCGGCGALRCGSCGADTHLGTPCAAFRKFEESRGLLDDEEASALYLRRNTRPCPKCAASIEKNGGCLHMRCWRCKHSFCWACGRPTDGPGTCGPYRCYATGVAGLRLTDSAGGAWARHESDDPSQRSWAGIPSDLLAREADALAAQRSAVFHKARASNREPAIAAAHWTLYLLYLRRWAELARCEGCTKTDERRATAYNLLPHATTLEAQLLALEPFLAAKTADSRPAISRRSHTREQHSVPELDLLVAQRALDAAVAKFARAENPEVLESFARPTVVAALKALIHRVGLDKEQACPRRQRTKPRRTTIISHQVTSPVRRPNPGPWQRGFVRVHDNALHDDDVDYNHGRQRDYNLGRQRDYTRTKHPRRAAYPL